MTPTLALTTSLPLAFGIDLEYMTGLKAAGLFALLALPVVLLGVRSLAGLGPVRRWVAIGVRLALILALVLLLGGVRWRREHKSVEVLVVRDISDSVEQLYRDYPRVSGNPNTSLQQSLDDFLVSATEKKYRKNPDDRIGVISMAGMPLIDWMPSTDLILDARAVRREGGATDIAAAIQLALATFSKDAMRRIVLVSDGNQTTGDLEGALAAAASQHVPIDIMKLRYSVDNEVIVDRVVAPSWKRESDAFDVYVSLLSTNREAVGGTVTLREEGVEVGRSRVSIGPATLGTDGKLEPRKQMERFKVPALRSRGVRRFTATFEPEVWNQRVAGTGGAAAPGAGTGTGTGAAQPARAGDTLLQNNTGSAFTFVQGQGRVLYVDYARDGGGKILADALSAQGINIDRVTSIEQVPEDLVKLQNYDAVILNNVPNGRAQNSGQAGLNARQDESLAKYVHDFGGGLVMIGGPDSFGAGGWQGSKVEEVLPVSCDVPAQRQMPKGALVLIVHSCEMPDGNYWGEQCALKAVETLSSRDDIGVISYDWQKAQGANGMANGSAWNYVLSPKGNGLGVTAAIKKMQPQDMPSFHDAVDLAVNGTGPNTACLKNNGAAQKHIIIISDGDPTGPQAVLMKQLTDMKISVSTVSVYPHGGGVPTTMAELAKATGGRYYGPIESNPNQLPQIFIKEATVVRRTLIQESEPGHPFPVVVQPTASDIMKGFKSGDFAGVTGYVLTTRKNAPAGQLENPLMVQVPTSSGEAKIDPLFAHWQAGLGKSAAFTSEAHSNWLRYWLDATHAGGYGKFWAQVVRGVQRPPMSSDFTVTTERQGSKAKIVVEATDKSGAFRSFYRIAGTIVDPEGKNIDVKLVQTGPGTYEAEFDTPKAGNYVAALQYRGGEGAGGGFLVSGLAVNDSPEMRELRSNDAVLEEIALKTGGRILTPWDVEGSDLFSRQHLPSSSSPLPVYDRLIPIILALLLLDVAVRRIAWDWASVKKMATAAADRVKEFTLTRQVESRPTLDALKRVRDGVAETKFKQPDAATGTGGIAPPVPDSKRKFEAGKGVEGDITQVVGGATDKPMPSAPKDPKPKGSAPSSTQGGHTGSLLEAKRRAQQKIKDKEQGDGR